MATKRRWLVPVSFGAHLVAGFALYAAGVWSIERLPEAHAKGIINVPTQLGAPAVDDPGGAAPARRTAVTKPLPRTLTQPVHVPAAQPPPTIAEVTAETGTGTGASDGPGAGPATGGGGEPCATPPCDAPAPPALEPPPPPPPPGPRIVPASVLSQQFLSGEREIHPPDSVALEMTRADHRRAIGVLKVCVAPTGAVAQANVLRSTGYPAYDDRLVAGASQWRYRPLVVDGQAVTACGTVTFIYEVR